MSQERTGPIGPDEGRADTDELANLQPDLAGEDNETPRSTGGSDVYETGQGAPPDSAESADDMGQQVIGELRERKDDQRD
jgi:hypothetical protein